MKKSALGVVLFLSLFLAGCLGFSDTDKDASSQEGFRLYQTEEFSIEVPEAWQVLTSQELSGARMPNTLVAFRSNVRNDLYTPNIAIVKNALSAEISSLEYAKALLQKMKTELINVKEIASEQQKLEVGKEEVATLLTILEGSESSEADLKRFIQVSGVSKKNAYIAIGSWLASEKQELGESIEKAVKSFKVK